MMKNTSGFHFVFDSADFCDQLPWPAGENVSVVSVIGKSSGRVPDGKDRLYRRLIGHSTRVPPPDTTSHRDAALWVEGFYSAANSVVYLQVHSALDTQSLLECCRKWNQRISTDGFLACWTELRFTAARALLWVFLLSHVVVVYSPGSAVDTSFVPLLQAVDTCRHKAHGYISERLHRLDHLPGAWLKHARTCTPRLLFYFGAAPAALRRPSGEQLEKLRRCLQSQIQHTLRRSRCMGGGASGQHALFSLPAHLPFVHVQEGERGESARAHVGQDRHQALLLLQQLCVSVDSSAAQLCEAGTAASSGGARLLMQHVRAGVESGFDEAVRGRQHSHFILPVASVWYRAARELFAAIVLSPVGQLGHYEGRSGTPVGIDGPPLTGLVKVLTNFQAALSGDTRFSEVRCSRALPGAVALYEDGLPGRYSRQSHEQRTRRALGAFRCRARGPACVRYLAELRRRCDRVWQQGRRMCEQLSLTGNPCINPVHLLPGDQQEEAADEGEEEGTGPGRLPTMEHCSGVRYLATCNCGRSQAQKSDPYTVRYANHEFFEQLAQSCCGRLAKHKFAVFTASAQHTSKAAVVSGSGGEGLMTSDEGGDALGDGHDDRDESLGQSYGLGLSQDNADDIDEDSDCAPEDEEHSPGTTSLPLEGTETHVTTADSSEGSEVEVVVSTDEYLDGMPTTATPPHLLPKYSSFSLVCTGPSSFYSHMAGLHGFVPGSNFLLPWGLRFKSDYTPQYQRPQRRYIRRRDDLYAKIFIGFEYECPRGHRFLMASKDRVLKAASSVQLRENVAELVNSDMPVYFNCLCSQPAKPFVAQLMRIHVVTAKSAVRVTMTVRVQPGGAGGAVFVPQSGSGAVELSPSAYWTYRLPHVYVDGGTVFAPPRREVPPTGAGRLLPDLFGVVIREEVV